MTMTTPETPEAQPYPVRLWMEYPERLSRLTTFFRIILVIPVVLFLYAVSFGALLPLWMAILVRGRAPRWLFDFQVGVNRFTYRAWAYFFALTDKYPAFEGNWVLQ